MGLEILKAHSLTSQNMLISATDLVASQKYIDIFSQQTLS